MKRFLKFCSLFVSLIFSSFDRGRGYERRLYISPNIYLFYDLIQFDSSLFHHLLISDRFDADTHGFIDGIECDYFSSAFFVYKIVRSFARCR